MPTAIAFGLVRTVPELSTGSTTKYSRSERFCLRLKRTTSYLAIGEQGGATPSRKKNYDPPLAFKMTPTPSEMAFWPPIQISSFFFDVVFL